MQTQHVCFYGLTVSLNEKAGAFLCEHISVHMYICTGRRHSGLPFNIDSHPGSALFKVWPKQEGWVHTCSEAPPSPFPHKNVNYW